MQNIRDPLSLQFPSVPGDVPATGSSGNVADGGEGLVDMAAIEIFETGHGGHVSVEETGQIIDGQGGHVGQVEEVGEGQDCWQGGHNSVRWVILEETGTFVEGVTEVYAVVLVISGEIGMYEDGVTAVDAVVVFSFSGGWQGSMQKG